MTALIRACTPSLILTCLLALTSCSFNEPTGSATGAAVGAGVGAGSAILLGADKPVIALAGLAGAGVGYYVTTLTAAEQPLIKGGGQVYSVGEFTTIVIPTDNIFDSNSADLLPEAVPVLDSALSIIDRYPSHNIMISGNTSGFGSKKFERALSEDRARQVATYFWAKGISTFRDQSISTRRLIYVGYGNKFPIANSIRVTGLRANSRIQITIFPSRSDLYPGRNYALFNDIGELKPAVTCNVPRHVATYKETTRTYPQPELAPNYKGDRPLMVSEPRRPSLPPYNIASAASQTTSPVIVVKRGGYTGDTTSLSPLPPR